MSRVILGLLAILFALTYPVRPVWGDPPAPKTTVIRAGRLVDTRGGQVLMDQHIVIEGERVQRVGPAGSVEVPVGADLIDLSCATVLPGLIDAHTHVLLQGDITETAYDDQLLKESIPFRTIRATVAVKTALGNGFTTMRDLETEGAMYADVDLKRAIERGIIPGPRLFVATRRSRPPACIRCSGIRGS